MLDKHIEELLNPKSDVSPLLKYFNHLARHSNFRIPSKKLLEFDQLYFRKYLNRLRDAQKLELKWQKKQIVDSARKTLVDAFYEARKLLQTEMKDVLAQFDDLKDKLAQQELKNAHLQAKIEEKEQLIGEQRVILQQTTSQIFEDDRALFEQNGGPGGAYENFIFGDVVKNIE